MEYLNIIPEEVVLRHILKGLSWNDLLRFRRVSKYFKRLVDSFISFHPEVAPELEINGVDRTFKQFVELGIVTKKLFLNNENNRLFYKKIGKKLFKKFSKRYAGEVTQLRVSKLTIFAVRKEQKLLKRFTNVQTFEAGRFVNGQVLDRQREFSILGLLLNVPVNAIFSDTLFPDFFNGLKSITIGQDPFDEAINRLPLSYEILNHCPNLQKASYPYDWVDLTFPVEVLRGTLLGEFYKMNSYLREQPNLKMFDFINFGDKIDCWDEWKTKNGIPAYWMASRESFLQLCNTAILTETYFKNVPSHCFIARGSGNEDEDEGLRLDRPEYGIPVLSLIGLHPCLMTLMMPNLEKITIPASSRSVGINEGDQTPDWPKLKSLEITVDQRVGRAWNLRGMKMLDRDITFDVMSVKGLYRLFFKNVMRVNMTELSIHFSDVSGRDEKPLIPRTEDIVASCPNLKKLKLGNWKGTNKALVTLWEGLTQLEDVELEWCEGLGNVAFVGEDVENPAFLKLKNLKKLTLKNLDKMPKITDLLFSKVLAKMNLKEFVITAWKPLEKVTKNGINALLGGPFAEGIEKFPFQDWSLANVTDEEFREMERQFRSYEFRQM